MSRLLCAVLAAVATFAGPAAAEDKPCSGFQWPVDQELAWMAAADPQAARAGDQLDSLPSKAVLVTLDPAATAKLNIPPSGKPHHVADQTFAGLVSFAGSQKASLYQISLETPGWIDVIQNGAGLKSSAHTGMMDCPALHKSVRFEIAPGPFSIQLSSMPSAQAKLTIRAVE
jgi:hypothetical protein